MANRAAAHHSDSTLLTQLAPCYDCRHDKSCAELRLACEAYAAYYSGAKKRRWLVARRVPQPAIYAALFDQGASIELDALVLAGEFSSF